MHRRSSKKTLTEVKIAKHAFCEIQLGNDVAKPHTKMGEKCCVKAMEASVILPGSEKIHFIYELLILNSIHCVCV